MKKKANLILTVQRQFLILPSFSRLVEVVLIEVLHNLRPFGSFAKMKTRKQFWFDPGDAGDNSLNANEFVD